MFSSQFNFKVFLNNKEGIEYVVNNQKYALSHQFITLIYFYQTKPHDKESETSKSTIFHQM